jgi:hypothetical protein
MTVLILLTIPASMFLALTLVVLCWAIVTGNREHAGRARGERTHSDSNARRSARPTPVTHAL